MKLTPEEMKEIREKSRRAYKFEDDAVIERDVKRLLAHAEALQGEVRVWTDNSTSWARGCMAWQEWAQALHGDKSLGDELSREAIAATLATLRADLDAGIKRVGDLNQQNATLRAELADMAAEKERQYARAEESRAEAERLKGENEALKRRAAKAELSSRLGDPRVSDVLQAWERASAAESALKEAQETLALHRENYLSMSARAETAEQERDEWRRWAASLSPELGTKDDAEVRETVTATLTVLRGDRDAMVKQAREREQERDEARKAVKGLKHSLASIDCAATQATTCARCGVYKHTPWRAGDGYICAGCLGAEVEQHLATIATLTKDLEQARKGREEDDAARVEQIRILTADKTRDLAYLKELHSEVERLRGEVAEQKAHVAGYEADYPGLLRDRDALSSLRAAAQGVKQLIEAAGLHNLTRGVELGPTVWYVKMHAALAALSSALNDSPEAVEARVGRFKTALPGRDRREPLTGAGVEGKPACDHSAAPEKSVCPTCGAWRIPTIPTPPDRMCGVCGHWRAGGSGPCGICSACSKCTPPDRSEGKCENPKCIGARYHHGACNERRTHPDERGSDE